MLWHRILFDSIRENNIQQSYKKFTNIFEQCGSKIKNNPIWKFQPNLKIVT